MFFLFRNFSFFIRIVYLNIVFEERLLKTKLHSLFELVVKQKTLFELFFLIFLIMIIMDLFKQLVIVM